MAAPSAVPFDDRGIRAAALRGLLRVSHDASCPGQAVRDDAGGGSAVVCGGRVARLVAPLSDGLRWSRVDLPERALTYRSERSPSRSSEAYSSGCSQAAKCPPRSSSL